MGNRGHSRDEPHGRDLRHRWSWAVQSYTSKLVLRFADDGLRLAVDIGGGNSTLAQVERRPKDL